MKKGTWRKRDDGVIEITVDETPRGGGGGIPIGPIGCIVVFLVIVGLIIGGLSFTGFFDAISFESNAEKAGKQITMEIVGKVEATETSRYDDGCVIAFEVKVQNKSKLFVETIIGEMVIYNAANQVLDTANCYLNCYVDAGAETTIVLNLDRHYSDEVAELYVSELDALRATFKVTVIHFENFQAQQYDLDPVSVLELRMDSGVSPVDKKYQEAVTLFNQKKYVEALAQLVSLNGYKDSEEIINEIYVIAEKEASAKAATGDYTGAYGYLADFGYTAENSEIYQAYQYAAEGNFSAAMHCGLTTVVVPDGVTCIEEKMFAYCTGFTHITLPNSVTRIENQAFYGCSGLVSVTLPNRLTEIGAEAFAYCSNLIEIRLPDTVTTIGDSAFCECNSLTTFAFGSGVVSVGEYLFDSCYSLTDVNIPEGLTAIPEGMFKGCRSLTSVTIPHNVVSIGSYAFRYCGLTSLTLGERVTSVGYESFLNCNRLVSVVFFGNFSRLGDKSFSECSSLTSITFKGTKAQWEEVYKGYSWSSYTGKFVIHCTDGDIQKK